MTDKTSCGPLYKASLQEFTDMSWEETLLFAAGFISGQAEKVYLGACDAAMFRPSSEMLDGVVAIVKSVAQRYGLEPISISTSRGTEIWISKPDTWIAFQIRSMNNVTENTPPWHSLRAHLCGIPVDNVDLKFHERVGYNEPCDV